MHLQYSTEDCMWKRKHAFGHSCSICMQIYSHPNTVHGEIYKETQSMSTLKIKTNELVNDILFFGRGFQLSQDRFFQPSQNTIQSLFK